MPPRPERSAHHITSQAPPRLLLLLCILALLAACQPKSRHPSASSGPTASASEQTTIFQNCADALHNLRENDPERIIDYFLEDAQGVLFFPNILKGGFVAGAQGGKGVFVVRQAPGRWSAPVFYSLAGASFGYQIGLQRIQALFIFMDRAKMLEALDAGFTLDTNYSWSMLNGGEAGMLSTMTMNNGAVAFLGVAGAYAGVSMQGGFVKPENATTNAFYGTASLTPRDLLLTPYPPPMRASPLYDALHDAVADLPPGHSPQLYP